MGVKKLAIVESGNAFYETALAFKTNPSASNWCAHIDAMKAYQMSMRNTEAALIPMLAFTSTSGVVKKLAFLFDTEVDQISEEVAAGRARILEVLR